MIMKDKFYYEDFLKLIDIDVNIYNFLVTNQGRSRRCSAEQYQNDKTTHSTKVQLSIPLSHQ